MVTKTDPMAVRISETEVAWASMAAAGTSTMAVAVKTAGTGESGAGEGRRARLPVPRRVLVQRARRGLRVVSAGLWRLLLWLRWRFNERGQRGFECLYIKNESSLGDQGA